ncbi:MAG: hypothetical protein E7530_07515 [Ruminococcaceae bacterium]|nr:hypothetical protein [Oscillospiraceae bacterium]
MSTSKKLIITSIFTAVVSIVLFCLGMYQEIDMIEFEYLLIFLYSAQAFMVLTLVFIVGAFLFMKTDINVSVLKKTVVTITAFIITVCILFIGYNSINFYDGYTPSDMIDNENMLVQEFFPYHKTDDEKNIDISVSHITGTDYLTFSSRSVSENGLYFTYDVEYFESVSPFMNLKFYLERGLLLPSDVIYVNAFSDYEEIEKSGFKAVIFTKMDNDDIGIYLRKGNKAIYSELKNDSRKPVNVEDFLEITIEQFETIELKVDENYFLDIPFSDKFNRRVLNK